MRFTPARFANGRILWLRIPLASSVVTKLRKRRMTPKLALFLRGYKAEREWLMPVALNDLVFANYDGKPLDPSTVTHNFGRIVKKAGLDVRVHDLRHSYATLRLTAGIHPKIVQEMLGHSSIQITLDTYSHTVPGMQKAAAEQLGSLLPSGVVISGGKR